MVVARHDVLHAKVEKLTKGPGARLLSNFGEGELKPCTLGIEDVIGELVASRTVHRDMLTMASG